MAVAYRRAANPCDISYWPTLTLRQSSQSTHLQALMEAEECTTPRAPPQGPAQKLSMEVESPGSKRKRHGAEMTISEHDIPDGDGHPAKRNRSHGDQTDVPPHHRSVRHKKGVRNLSNMNLRHAAAQQTASGLCRESKFQEGSLADEPSGKLANNAAASSPSPYKDGPVIGEQGKTPDSQKQQGSGFLHFLSNLPPVVAFNKMVNEEQERYYQEQREKAERELRRKRDAEAKKSDPNVGGQSFWRVFGAQQSPEASASQVGKTNTGDSPMSTDGGQAITPNICVADMSNNSLNPPTTLKSRFHLKRPSLSNLKPDLKRAKSDFKLNGSAARESSVSLSPPKFDAEDSSLRKSRSKYDLKKQHKLSKRVSDLEVKLEQARKELDDALAEASPIPKLGTKFERFTPSSTLKRPRFVPGALPTLPSEQILSPELAGHPRQSNHLVSGDAQARTQKDSSTSPETIRSRPRAKSPEAHSELISTRPGDHEADTNTNLATNDSIHNPEMDPSNFIQSSLFGGDDTTGQRADWDGLDAKLKALEKSHKSIKKQNTPKKRKTGVDLDKPFKPNQGDDDDAEWDEADETPKKKKQRKSTAKRQGGTPDKHKAPTSTKPAPAGETKVSPKGLKRSRGKLETRVRDDTSDEPGEAAFADDAEGGESDRDELAGHVTLRSPMESPPQLLEPVYEEEEETSTIPVNGEPSKPTAKATPARPGPRVERARAGSPKKTSPPPQNYSEPAKVTKDIVTVTPGTGHVPDLPKGANGSFESLDELQRGNTEIEVLRPKKRDREAYQWPDDIF